MTPAPRPAPLTPCAERPLAGMVLTAAQVIKAWALLYPDCEWHTSGNCAKRYTGDLGEGWGKKYKRGNDHAD